MNTLEKIIKESKTSAKYAVIWLHGLGADGHDFESLVPELGLADTRFIFPHAPVRPVTINAGMFMRAWYDISALSLDAKEDEVGIRDSQKLIEQLIEEQVELGIDSKNIFLVGFSQGAAMALHTGLRYPDPLAGIIALSSYLPLRNQLVTELNSQQKETPVFMAHGMYDMVLPFLFGQACKMMLDKLGFQVEWHEYAMEHCVCPEEIADLKEFMQNVKRPTALT